jgi:hypothetical protein
MIRIGSGRHTATDGSAIRGKQRALGRANARTLRFDARRNSYDTVFWDFQFSFSRFLFFSSFDLI